MEVFKYHKIQTVYKRQPLPNGKFSKYIIEGDWSKPEFEYLAKNDWYWFEKIDGTNIRIIWNGEKLEFRGRTDKANIPKYLINYLTNHFEKQIDKFKDIFDNKFVILFGEGYGNKIQAVGKDYISNNVSFIGFDININGIWLDKFDAKELFNKFNTNFVPYIKTCNLFEAIDIVKQGFKSKIAQNKDLQAEGLIGVPIVQLNNRLNERIITKLKTRDFEK